MRPHETQYEYYTPDKALMANSSKEMKKTMEKIVKTMMIERESKLKKTIEDKTKDLVKNAVNDLKLEYSKLETLFLSKISDVEEKQRILATKCEDMNKLIDSKNSALSDEISKLSESSKLAVEKERQKRLEMSKKVHNTNHEEIKTLSTKLENLTGELTKQVQLLHQDVSTQARELSMMRDGVDELLIKKYGNLPTELPQGGKKTFQQGSDSLQMLDIIQSKLTSLEKKVHKQHKRNSRDYSDEEDESSDYEDDCDEDDDNYRYSHRGLKSKTSRRRSSGSPKKGLQSKDKQKYQAMEDTIAKMETHQISLQDEVEGLQRKYLGIQQSIDLLRQMDLNNKVSSQLESSLNNSHPTVNNHSNTSAIDVKAEDIKGLRRKIRELGETTAKACRSLGNGINDIQQVNLNLYQWADQAYNAIGFLSSKLGIDGNPCPSVPTMANDLINSNQGSSGLGNTLRGFQSFTSTSPNKQWGSPMKML